MSRKTTSSLKSSMEISSHCKPSRILSFHLNSFPSKCVFLAAMALFIRALLVPQLSPPPSRQDDVVFVHNRESESEPQTPIRNDKFLEVPQIVWGLNNQKIALARSFLTARLLNRTLLMPSLSASLFYKELDLLEPIPFDKLFNFDKFNSLCHGFARLGNHSDLRNKTRALELRKGSGRRWSKERDLAQLQDHKRDPIDGHELIKIAGKNPFLWHDHWPVKDYARVLECLVLVDPITAEADRVVSEIKSRGTGRTAYVAVHMRVERDWMIHCKNLEKKRNLTEICSSKAEITARVGQIPGLGSPALVYVAVADKLLGDDVASVLTGWRDGLVILEKKRLGVDRVYAKYPYLIQSAIDYEVCLRSDVFVGNSFSTFSSLIVLERTQRTLRSGFAGSCGGRERDLQWPSYAYNVGGESGGPKIWMTKMSDPSLEAVSYGTNEISC